jgi:molybdopterin synthase sulfur carrier subunit
MKIRVRYFAQLREMLGLSEEDFETQASDVAGLRQALIARGGAYAEALAPDQAIRCALNQQLCTFATPLSDGAEVAFFPPVTGG